MRTPHRKTRASWNEPGHAHFLTYSCYRRLPLLSSDRSRGWVVAVLERVRREMDVALWAYVVMPEHVHVLLCPRQPQYEMRRILAALKRPVAAAAKEYLTAHRRVDWLERLTIRRSTRTVFRFWQPGGGFDRNIVRERTVPAVMNYIHGNPVRRELVDHPTDWGWSSARHWEHGADTPLRMDPLDA